MTFWLHRYSTHLLAVSRDAAAALFGLKSLDDARLHIIPSGLDLIPFQKSINPVEIKASLGLPPEGKIVGHIGRFEEPKNHFFFLQVAQSLARKDPNLWFLLVGNGPLRRKTEVKAKEMGLAERTVFAGVRSDVPRILKGAFDLLLFPSKWEGTPRVILEAQSCGLPCLISDVIPPDVDLVKPLIKRLSLAEPPEIWAAAAWELLQSPPPVSPAEALRLVEESPFNIDNNVRELEKLYLIARKQMQG